MKLLGHPIHPILIVFPLGLLSMAAIFDLLFLLTTNSLLPVVAYYMLLSGVITGVVAEVFGLLDWLQMRPNTRAKNVGAWHRIGNFFVVLMFGLSTLLRQPPTFVPDLTALGLSFGGSALMLVTGWLGGEMVYRMGVAVDQGAHENSPNSLTHKKAK